ncbi:MAG TPA: MnhB domain-containing protein [Verrucomicrobiae bacterium]|nr:MnhB domain-containing protein [Verrucomicrobiae bacterium]
MSAAFALFGLMVWGVLGLSPFGLYPGPYGDVLNAVAYRERHVLNVVTSVIFDYRGFDTLGEEFILFACVTGVTLLMRHEGVQSEEDCPPEPPRGQGREPPAFPPASEATQFFSAGYIGLLLVFGVYVVLTGHLSVGGGFQGGLLLSSAWLLALVAFGSRTFRRFSNNYVVEWFESTGAAAYVLIGLAGLAVGQNFLTNILPLGQPGQLLSSGTILLINCGVGVEVAAGFISLFCEFVKPLENEGPER